MTANPRLITLVPLTAAQHCAALQAVYAATPAYWQLFNWPHVPAGQAEHDLTAAQETPGRTLLGIVQRVRTDDPAAGGELIGLVDFRLHWPGQEMVYLGMILVAGPLQRQGIGTQAWFLLEPWLRAQAGMHKARLGVEQFNPAALRFFQHLGFQLTGQTDRYRVNDQFVRLLYMEKRFPSEW